MSSSTYLPPQSEVAAALAGVRTVTDLCDRLLALTVRWFPAGSALALYVERDDRFWLEAQIGFAETVHVIPGDEGPADAARRGPVAGGEDGALVYVRGALADRAALIVARVVTSDEDRAAAVPALRETLDTLSRATGTMSERARSGSPLAQLSRAVHGLLGDESHAAVMERACRAIGQVLRVECVQGLVGDRDDLETVAVWRFHERGARAFEAGVIRQMAKPPAGGRRMGPGRGRAASRKSSSAGGLASSCCSRYVPRTASSE